MDDSNPMTRWHIDLPLPQPSAYVRFLIDAENEEAAVARARFLARDRGWTITHQQRFVTVLGRPKEVIGPGGHKVSRGAE